jgi:hypothetical protein
MATPVNLNRFRKEKSRAEKKARASENALKFGRTKAEKSHNIAVTALDKKRLDGHKRDDQT